MAFKNENVRQRSQGGQAIQYEKCYQLQNLWQIEESRKFDSKKSEL